MPSLFSALRVGGLLLFTNFLWETEKYKQKATVHNGKKAANENKTPWLETAQASDQRRKKAKNKEALAASEELRKDKQLLTDLQLETAKWEKARAALEEAQADSEKLLTDLQLETAKYQEARAALEEAQADSEKLRMDNEVLQAESAKLKQGKMWWVAVEVAFTVVMAVVPFLWRLFSARRGAEEQQAATEALQALRHREAALRQQAAKLEQRREALVWQVAELEGRREALRLQTPELEGRTEALQGQVAELEGRREALRLQTAESERRRKALEGQVVQLEGRREGLVGQAAELERRRKALEGQVVQLEGRREALEGQARDLDSGKKALKEQVRELRGWAQELGRQQDQIKERSDQWTALEQRARDEEVRLSQEREELLERTYFLGERERALHQRLAALPPLEFSTVAFQQKVETWAPHYWTGTASDSTRLHLLTRQDRMDRIEMKFLNNLFFATGSFDGRDVVHPGPGAYTRLQIVKAWRVQNLVQWNMYASRRRQIETDIAELRERSTPTEQLVTKFTGKIPTEHCMRTAEANETFLLHGTCSEVIEHLLKRGFNAQLANVNGLFGGGLYFAEDCEKSNQYASPGLLHEVLPAGSPGVSETSTEEVFFNLVCRVAFGHFRRTKQSCRGLREMPQIEDTPTIRYHGLLGETGGAIKRHRELIVFHKDQTYIEYLVAYKRV